MHIYLLHVAVLNFVYAYYIFCLCNNEITNPILLILNFKLRNYITFKSKKFELSYLKSRIDLDKHFCFSDKARGASVSSGGFSEYDEGGEFGSSGVMINEWQAAWNVTNAIQAR